MDTMTLVVTKATEWSGFRNHQGSFYCSLFSPLLLGGGDHFWTPRGAFCDCSKL